jgi:integrin beta 2
MIPTISLPQVLSPSQLDFVAANRKIYWTDVQVNEVKRTGLTGGVTESIIDTGEGSYIVCLFTIFTCTVLK